MHILQYCPASDLWMPFAMCKVHIRKQQMVSVEETIYIVGGCLHEPGSTRRSSQSEDTLAVQSYNTVTRQWRCLKENTSKSGLNLTCALHNDGIYIMSRDYGAATSMEHRVFLKYNIFSDSWRPSAASPPSDTICSCPPSTYLCRLTLETPMPASLAQEQPTSRQLSTSKSQCLGSV